MRVLVIGPGALGIVAAVKLHKAGVDVEVAVRDEAKADRLNAAGLVMMDSHGQDHHARVPCVWDPATSGPYDLIIHTTKLDVAEEVMRTWLPTLAPDGWVVPFQNGVHGDVMQAVVGKERFIEGSVYWPATLVEEGYSQHTGEGTTVIGPWPEGHVSADHERIADVLGHITTCRTSDQMRGVKWSKLAINAAMTSCGMVSGKTLGEMVRHRPSRRAFVAVIRETLDVMNAAGIPVVRIGPSKPDLLVRLPEWGQRIILAGVARRYGQSRSSGAQDIRRGRRTEVDFLNGLIASEGRRLGLRTPVNSIVVETVHSIEDGKVEPGLDVVDEMMAHASV